MSKKIFFILLLIIFTALTEPTLVNVVSGQELLQEEIGNFRAEVVEILSTDSKVINENFDPVITQEVVLRFISGPLAGENRTVTSDTFNLSAGDRVHVNYRLTADDTENFFISDLDRIPQLIIVILMFIVSVIAFGRWQGVRSLVALASSFLAIFYVLLPLLLAGYSPVLVSTVVAGLVLFGAIFFTHGFNRESVVAFSGTMIAVLITGIMSKLAITLTGLTGLGDEASVYLSFSNGGNLDFSGLLLGSIIIGVLGVLDDISITQSAVVTELYSSNKSIKPIEVYRKAMRVGREHVGALVNTLVLAYTASALPLLLLFYGSDSSLISIVNRELFASEIVRTVIGSIGLILTVPIVTWLAVKFLKDYKPSGERLGGHSHHHHH